MDKTLKQIEKFHGHIGPYAILGYKMGKIGNKKLGSDPFCKKAKVYTGTNPPISCIIDGIQLSSNCTVGNGGIKVEEKNHPRVDFISNKNNRKISIVLKPEIKKEIDTTVTQENMIEYSKQIYKKSDEELFEIL